MKKCDYRCPPQVKRGVLAIALAVISGLAVSSVVYAAVSFKGQGRIDFDRIKTGALTVTGTAGFLDSIQNPNKWRPLKVNDSLKITKNLDLLGVLKNTTAGKPVKVDDNLTVTNNLDLRGVLKNTATGKPVKVKDNLHVTGNLSVNGTIEASNFSGLSDYAHTSDLSLYAKLTDLSAYATTSALATTNNNLATTNSNVDILINNTNVLYYYLDCVSEFAQYTTYLESYDTIFCWNLWIAGSGKMANPKDASYSPAIATTEAWPSKSLR